MYNRLYNFLTEHNILSTNQFGFRKKYSTFLALMDLVDNISKNIDEGNYSIGRGIRGSVGQLCGERRDVCEGRSAP